VQVLYDTDLSKRDRSWRRSASCSWRWCNTACRNELPGRANPARTAGLSPLARWVTGGWEALEVVRSSVQLQDVRMPGAGRLAAVQEQLEPQPAQQRTHPNSASVRGSGCQRVSSRIRPLKIVCAEAHGTRRACQESITKKVTTVPRPSLAWWRPCP